MARQALLERLRRCGGRRSHPARCVQPYVRQGVRPTFACHALAPHSHSIVEGGFGLMSYTTRPIAGTSFKMRREIASSTS